MSTETKQKINEVTNLIFKILIGVAAYMMTLVLNDLRQEVKEMRGDIQILMINEAKTSVQMESLSKRVDIVEQTRAK